MGNKRIVAFNFDYNTKFLESNLQELQINGTYNKAYYDIGKCFNSHGLRREQGSGYVSEKPMSEAKVNRLLKNIHKDYPYMRDAFKKFSVSYVAGNIYDLTQLVRDEHSVKILEPENLHKLETDYSIKLDASNNKEREIRFDYNKYLLKDSFEKYGIEKQIDVYAVTRKFFKDKGYKPEQGSVYRTTEGISDAQILRDILEFSEKYPHLAEGFKSVQICNIDAVYDVTDLVNTGKSKTKSHKVEKSAQIEFKINKETNSIEL